MEGRAGRGPYREEKHVGDGRQSSHHIRHRRWFANAAARIAVIGGILISMVLSLIITPAVHFYPTKEEEQPPVRSELSPVA